MKILGSFTITNRDTEDFARASGDFNPLHLDPLAARRTQFGHTLIHGVCGTIKALDLLLKHRNADSSLLGIKVKFSKPATQNQDLTVYYQTSGESTRLEVFASGTRCQVIDVDMTDTPKTKDTIALGALPGSEGINDCLEQSIEACRGLSGSIDLIREETLNRALFPNATRHLPDVQLAILLASTRIVGMRCPGLHSVFAQLHLQFTPPEPGPRADADTSLDYKVLTCDARIARVELSLRNNCVNGTVEAFFRSPPVSQAGFSHIASLISPQEFCNQHALVIGASRGLGEIISKVLAAGGARVTMTYAAGRQDAACVAQDIGAHCPEPEVFHYDVLGGSPDAAMISSCTSVTHIYYLASPVIAKNETGQWDPELFTRYCRYYIDGMATLLAKIDKIRPDHHRLHLFIPSSVFLEQRVKGFDEYIAAKAAAEAFARCYENAHEACSVVAPRLPRLHTDQTAGIKNIAGQQTLEVIIRHLRLAFADAGSTSTSAR